MAEIEQIRMEQQELPELRTLAAVAVAVAQETLLVVTAGQAALESSS